MKAKKARKAQKATWHLITEGAPALGEIVWLWDGLLIWIGGRDKIDSEHWLWGNTNHSIWHNGVKWDGDLECDDDYQPTHWMELPTPPRKKGKR